MDPVELVDQRADLVRPTALTVDGGLAPDRARTMVRVSQIFCTFWHTGDPRFLVESVAPSFEDRTLPPGRRQGLVGAATALAERRVAVPDLTCELADLLVVGDRATVRLHFRGTFTGVSRGIVGSGERVDFIAFDIVRIGADRVVEDWHLEDNLTLLQQTGLVRPQDP